MSSSLRASILALLAATFSACANGGNGTVSDPDASTADVAPSDVTQPEASVDASAPDVASDASASDVASDVSAPEASVDAMSDASAPDAASDASAPDAASDASAPDAASDVASDVTVDAGCGATWPSCDARPSAAMASTIEAVWTMNPSRPTFVWVSGAVVTAISRGGCASGSACQVFVQEPTGATTLADAAHHAIKVFISAASSARFTTIRVGDRVDVAAYAWRYNVSGQNELLLQVADSCSLRGCMARTGDGTLASVPATLSALASVNAYETGIGPVLVRLADVQATTDATTPLTSTTGGLFATGTPFDAGLGEPVSVSPFFLPDSHFVGYTASQRLRFTSLTGVFGMFMPSGSPGDGGVAKYLQIYPRTTGDLVTM